MNWKRRTRAVAWAAMLMLACSFALPSATAAFPIKQWINPQLGEPDEPSYGGVVFKIGGWEFFLVRGYLGLIVIPSGRSDRIGDRSTSSRALVTRGDR